MSLLDRLEQSVFNSLEKNVTSPLSFTQGTNSSNTPTVPEQGNINNNLYNGKSFSVGGKFSSVGGPLDVLATTHWLRNISRNLGVGDTVGALTGLNMGNFASNSPDDRATRIGRGFTYIARNFLLASLNKGAIQLGGPANQLPNPLHFAATAIPFARSQTLGTHPIAAQAFVGHKYNAAPAGKSSERLIMATKGRYIESPGANTLIEKRSPDMGLVGSTTNSGKSNTLQDPDGTFATGVTIEGQVNQEGLSANIVRTTSVHTNVYTPNENYQDKPVSNLKQLEKDTRQGYSSSPVPEEYVINAATKFYRAQDYPDGPRSATRSKAYSWVAHKAFDRVNNVSANETSRNVSARFYSHDQIEQNGVVKETPIPDNDIYMPFMFQDLRVSPEEFLYFRAFIKDGSLSENFMPEWQQKRYFGRVDLIPTYIGTTRTISLSFDVVAWSPADLPVIYRKLHKLQSMVYPTFDTKAFLNAGPLIKMRVGDLISAPSQGVKKGLPGYITSMNVKYGDVWSIETDYKAPMLFTVSLEYTVLHEGNPGSYPAANPVVTDTPGVIDPLLAKEGSSDNSYIFGAIAPVGSGEDSSTSIFQSKIRGITKKVSQYYAANNLGNE